MKEEKEKLPLNEEQKQSGEVTRRDFLVGAGTVVVGGAIGAGLLSSCNGDTVTTTVTSTKTVPTTVTSTVGGAGATVTETVGAGETVTATKTVTQTGTSSAVEPWQEEENTIVRGFGFLSCDASCVDTKNGRIVRIRPLHYDWNYSADEVAESTWQFEAKGKTYKCKNKALPNYFSYAYKKRVYTPNRIMYPLKRVDFDVNADPTTGRNTQNRGKSKFKRITWDEATTMMADEIKRVQETYGPYSVLLVGMDGHVEEKVVHRGGGTHCLPMTYFNGYTAEVRNADSWEGWYWGAEHVWGTCSRGLITPALNIYPDVLRNTEMIVFQGCDWETTPNGGPGMFLSTVHHWFRDAGIKQIFIAPDANYACVVHADKWIPVIANTDAALQLAVIYTWINEDIYKKDYVDTHVYGFDKFKEYVMGDVDGTPKTPEWASPICGVPEWTIKALAREWAGKVTSTGHWYGGSFQRGPYSHEPARLECIELGMQGLGGPGVHQIHNGSKHAMQAPTLNSARGARAMEPITPQILPRTLVHHAILNGTVTHWGTTARAAAVENQFVKYTYPIPEEEGGSKVHMLWSEKPCNTVCWNCGNMFVDAVRSPEVEFYVCQQQTMENDCIYADLVLPITSGIEESDVGSTGFGQKEIFMYCEQAVEPAGESMSDYQVALAVAEKLGVADQVSGGKTFDEWKENAYNIQKNATELLSWNELKERKYFMPPVDPEWENAEPGVSAFYNNPDDNPLNTPSGLLEFYSDRLEENFPDDEERGPYPKWVPGGPEYTHDESQWGERCKQYPLVIVSNHPRWREHPQMDDNCWIREIPTCKVTGYDGYKYTPVWINPIDAEARGIAHGDIVKVYNERGIELGGAYVTPRIIAGCLSMDHGSHMDPITDNINRGGSVNPISPERGTSQNCWGEATSGYLVEVEKLDPAQMDEWRKEYPEAFTRAYDPDYGLLREAWLEGEAD